METQHLPSTATLQLLRKGVLNPHPELEKVKPDRDCPNGRYRTEGEYQQALRGRQGVVPRAGRIAEYIDHPEERLHDPPRQDQSGTGPSGQAERVEVKEEYKNHDQKLVSWIDCAVCWNEWESFTAWRSCSFSKSSNQWHRTEIFWLSQWLPPERDNRSKHPESKTI